MPKARTDIPIEILRECFELDATLPTGLRWKHRPIAHFAGNASGRKTFNTRYAGKPAGSAHSAGYFTVGFSINGHVRAFLCHRVVFALAHGRWPIGEIDHEDRNKASVSIGNLREATHAQNGQNVGMYAHNTSGVKGVCWDKSQGKWHAQMGFNGRNLYLGLYSTIEEAEATVVWFRQHLHPFAPKQEVA